jgi:hypothetical protein
MPTIPEVDTKIDTDLPTNSVGQITASRLRGVLHYISSALGGATVTSGAVPEATRTVMQTLSFASPPDSIRTNGFDEVGVGPAFYVKAPGNAIPAHWPSSGVLTTGDGTNYLITPENGTLWVEQFGAKGRTYSDSTDQWQAFEDCKYIILLQPDTGGFGETGGGLTMRIGRGAFYLSKSHSIEGASYNIRGSGQYNGGTTLRCPTNVDCIQVQHHFGGQGQTFGHEGSPLNNFARVLNSLSYVPGGTHVYKSTNTGVPNLSSPPTGTGTGIVSGTATFDYVRERTWAEMRGVGSGYSVISDLQIWGTWAGATDPIGYDENLTNVDGAFHSGIVMKTRCTIQDVYTLSFPGHGIAIAADGDPEIRSAGNANGWVMRRIKSYFNGHDGIHIGLADANAGMGQDIDTASNHRTGVADFNFLANRWLNIQDAFSGSSGPHFKGGVSYNGYYWTALAPTSGATTVNYLNAPGTDEFSWYRNDGNGVSAPPTTDFPAWSATPSPLAYAPCGGYISNNANSENQIVGLYIEGGGYGSQLGIFDSVWGGPMGNTPNVVRGGQLYLRNKWQNQMRVQVANSFDDARKTMEVYMGGRAQNLGLASKGPENTVWGYQDYEGTQVRLKLVGPTTARDSTGLDAVLANDASADMIMAYTTANSTRTFGRGTAQIDVPVLRKLVFGNGSSNLGDASYTIFETTTGNLGTGSTAATGKRNGEVVFYVNTGATTGDPLCWRVEGGLYKPHG